MGDLAIAQWKRYGHHRVYANDESGTRLGYLDVTTGQVHTESEASASSIAPALHEWCAQNGVHVLAGEESAENEWYDLAQNQPGQLLREQANAEWEKVKGFSGYWARVMDTKTDERSWRVGANGEEHLGRELNWLLSHFGWHVLHSVPVGKRGSDIDHVLIGPGGVITVNAKNHPGGKVWVSPRQIRVNGHPEPYIRNSLFEAERASKLLSEAVGASVPVTPIIIFVEYAHFSDKGLPEGMWVGTMKDALKVLPKLSGRYTPEQVGAIYAVARRSATWCPQHN